ncbi:MAG: hypothetical protein WC850_01505 [Candidatus Gracilibacteria bacterium]
MTLDNIGDKVGEGVRTVEGTGNIGQSTDETAKEVISLLSKDPDKFGFFTLTDLEKVGKPNKNLLSKSLGIYEGVDISFQSTKGIEGGAIAEHSLNNSEKNDVTDELIIMMNEGGVYGDIGTFITEEGIMKIPAGDEHGGKSNGNWISLKPRGYTFIGIDNDDGGFFYGNGQKEIKIMKLSGDKVFLTRELGYKDDVLFLEFGSGLVNIRKNINGRIMSSNWDFVIIGEVE